MILSLLLGCFADLYRTKNSNHYGKQTIHIWGSNIGRQLYRLKKSINPKFTIGPDHMGVNIAKLAQIEVVRDMKKENHDQIA